MNNDSYDLVIKGKKIAFENGVSKGKIAVKNGKIVAITDINTKLKTENEINTDDKIVVPGVVDPHVHFKDPGANNFREDFHSGTKQAAAGGVTTVVEMPLSIPMVTDKKNWDNKVQAAKKQAVVDYALWAGMNKIARGHYEELKKAGCVAFKAFLSTDPDSPRMTDFELLKDMQDVKKLGGMMGVHAENADIIDNYVKEFREAGRQDGMAHKESRPDVAEIEAVQKVMLFSLVTDCKVYICHLSSAMCEDVIDFYRKKGAKITVETCMTYLVLDDRDLVRCGPHAKCNPPLRSKENKEKLWKMIFNGKINTIGSDHCPYVDDDRKKDDFWDVPPGMSGIDLMLPLIFEEGVLNRGMSIEKLCDLLAKNPAKAFGLYPEKGAIKIGADADFAIIDPKKEWTWSWKNSLGKSKSKHTPFEGRKIKGKVVTTIVRGKVVYDHEEIKVEPGYGKLIIPNENNA